MGGVRPVSPATRQHQLVVVKALFIPLSALARRVRQRREVDAGGKANGCGYHHSVSIRRLITASANFCSICLRARTVFSSRVQSPRRNARAAAGQGCPNRFAVGHRTMCSGPVMKASWMLSRTSTPPWAAPLVTPLQRSACPASTPYARRQRQSRSRPKPVMTSSKISRKAVLRGDPRAGASDSPSAPAARRSIRPSARRSRGEWWRRRVVGPCAPSRSAKARP